MNKHFQAVVATLASFLRSQGAASRARRPTPLIHIPRDRQIIMMPYWCKRQPGWRAEASRNRHREIMRRRRRNASRT